MSVSKECRQYRCPSCDLPDCSHACHLTEVAALPFDDGPVLPITLNPRTHARAADPHTSHTAAARLTDKTTMLRALTAQYHNGAELTAEEAATRAGYTPADGAWKRISDLLNQGVLEDTGRTRKASSGRSQRVLRRRHG